MSPNEAAEEALRLSDDECVLALDLCEREDFVAAQIHATVALANAVQAVAEQLRGTAT